jgi:ferric-dicitrate binding protein FerR (iron transport regulator)
MKKSGRKRKYRTRDWEEIASALSGEKVDASVIRGEFIAGDNHDIVGKWEKMAMINDNRKIDVDVAWEKLSPRLNDAVPSPARAASIFTPAAYRFMKAAAVVVILLAIGGALYYQGIPGLTGRKIVVTTGSNQDKQPVILPDGSLITLNRGSKLTYNSKYGKHRRNVSLRGEAFFEITGDSLKPFVVDAGRATVKVIGTSFNVITDTSDSGVEVFVETGKVILSGISAGPELVLEPGYVGKIDHLSSGKSLNVNPNYLAWKTGILVYDGQTLDIVFRDLKKVFNMDIVADDPAIMKEKWTSTINNKPEETIIRLICGSFMLSYSRDGNTYHLARQ